MHDFISWECEPEVWLCLLCPSVTRPHGVSWKIELARNHESVLEALFNQGSSVRTGTLTLTLSWHDDVVAQHVTRPTPVASFSNFTLNDDLHFMESSLEYTPHAPMTKRIGVLRILFIFCVALSYWRHNGCRTSYKTFPIIHFNLHSLDH
jgi:hypothetical protein